MGFDTDDDNHPIVGFVSQNNLCIHLLEENVFWGALSFPGYILLSQKRLNHKCLHDRSELIVLLCCLIRFFIPENAIIGQILA